MLFGPAEMGDLLTASGEPGNFLAARGEFLTAVGEFGEYLLLMSDFFAAMGEFFAATGELCDFFPPIGDPLDELLVPTGSFLAATGEPGAFLAATAVAFLAVTGECLAAAAEVFVAAVGVAAVGVVAVGMVAVGMVAVGVVAVGVVAVDEVCAAFSGASDEGFLVLCRRLVKKLFFLGFWSLLPLSSAPPTPFSTLPSRCSMGVAWCFVGVASSSADLVRCSLVWGSVGLTTGSLMLVWELDWRRNPFLSLANLSNAGAEEVLRSSSSSP